METQQSTLSTDARLEPQSLTSDQPQESQRETKATNKSDSVKDIIDQIAVLVSRGELSKEDLEQVGKLRSLARRLLLDINSSRRVTPQEVEVAAVQEARLGDLNRTIREYERLQLEQRNALYEQNRVASVRLLDELAKLLEPGEDFGKVYADFHRIREQWQACRPLDPKEEAAQKRTFAELRDKFYELKAINEELRNYDYRKNLEAKRALLDELKGLMKQTDVLALYRSALPLIGRWHELGPVAKDLRFEINNEFKTLSTQVFKLHEDFQLERKERTQRNLEAKTRLCEQAEAIVAQKIETYKQRQTANEQLKNLKEEWRKLDYSSSRDDERLYHRFRVSFDSFYQEQKALKREKDKMQRASTQRKLQLIEEAQRIAESSDWESGMQRIKEIQQEWKQTPHPSAQASHKLWQELRKHIDRFFERKSAEQKGQGSSFEQNLERKRAILTRLESLKEEQDLATLRKQIDEIGAEWKAIGYVPSKYKDEVNGSYKAYLDEFYGRLRKGREQRRLDGYTSRIEQVATQEGGLQQELRRLQYALERAKSELQIYENNLGFLNVDSKGGSGLLQIVARKREQLAKEISLMQEKLALLRSKM